MATVIGIDEAGYGPNLGPLVVAATVWDVPGNPHRFDFWKALSKSVCQTGSCDDRLHVADSKLVHKPARGLQCLETSAATLLSSWHPELNDLDGLRERLDHHPRCSDRCAWEIDSPVPLPVAADADVIDTHRNRFAANCNGRDVRLMRICAAVVSPWAFNELIEQLGTKAAALSTITLRLLGSCWDPDDSRGTLAILDKHGGRNRYDGLLAEFADDRMIFCREESRQRSVYRIGTAEVHFQMKGERHLPVAAASLVAKYVRELCMLQFNRFWQRYVPDLRPTAGYPGDSRRFRDDVAAARTELGIPDDVFWRKR